jgi:SAM-dependent methyltransferase
MTAEMTAETKAETKAEMTAEMKAGSVPGGPVFVEYCCPGCKGKLEELAAAYFCKSCDRSFPVVLSIPDFRLRPDPYIGIAEDHRKARLLAEKFDRLDLRGMLEYYWQLPPDTPPELSQRFVEHALEGRSRGRHWLSADTKGGPMLELGCRSGGMLAAAAETGAEAVGIELAFRWLVIARKCLEEAGLQAQLCCCDAEHLPFREGSFDVVLAENVLEHTARQAPLLAETHRVLRVEGVARGVTWNRLAPAPEPHVRLWGVGWMPRRVARRYVRWRGKGDYEHIYLVSAFALRRLLRNSPLLGGKIYAAEFPPVLVERLPKWVRGLTGFYHAVRKWPLARTVLAWVGPVLEWQCVRRRTVA